jgi:hypothetical protein
MGETDEKNTPIAPRNPPWGCRRRRSSRFSLAFYSPRLLRPFSSSSPQPNLSFRWPWSGFKICGVWSGGRWGSSLLGGRLLSTDPIGTGEPRPPRCRLRPEAGGCPLHASSSFALCLDACLAMLVRCLSATHGRCLWPRYIRSSRTLPNRDAIYCRRNVGRLRCGDAVPRILATATPE